MHFLFFESEFKLKFKTVFLFRTPSANRECNRACSRAWIPECSQACNQEWACPGNMAWAVDSNKLLSKFNICRVYNSTFIMGEIKLQSVYNKNDQTFTLGNYSCSFKCFIFFHPTYMKCTKKINYINAKSICSTKTILHTVHALFFDSLSIPPTPFLYKV